MDSAPHISHTEKSNAGEWNRVHTSRGPNPTSPVAANTAAAASCPTSTPLGVPVEPEV